MKTFREQFDDLDIAVIDKFNAVKKDISFIEDEDAPVDEIVDSLASVDFYHRRDGIITAHIKRYSIENGFEGYDEEWDLVRFGFNDLISLEDKITVLELFSPEL